MWLVILSAEGLDPHGLVNASHLGATLFETFSPREATHFLSSPSARPHFCSCVWHSAGFTVYLWFPGLPDFLHG